MGGRTDKGITQYVRFSNGRMNMGTVCFNIVLLVRSSDHTRLFGNYSRNSLEYVGVPIDNPNSASFSDTFQFIST